MSHRSEEKKKKIRERNLRNWLIFMHSDLHRIKVDIGAPVVQRNRGEKKTEKKEKKVWSAQLTTVRNRLDNSKRSADDRFNRFAGTSDGGGRGR